MIIVKLVGGLGNQLFQYALGRHLAIKNNTQLKLDISYLLNRTPRPNVVFRDFDLPIFNINAQIATSTEVSRFTGMYKSRFQTYWHRVINRLSPAIILEEKNHSFDESALQALGNCYVKGYWQSEKYFQEIEPVIRAEFTFKDDILKESVDMAEMIRNSNSVCLNVRRTDFVNVASSNETLGFVGTDYYVRAMAYVEQRMEKPTYFIFSDDLDWCKTNLPIKKPHFFVEHSHAGKKFYNYLLLMSMCKHYIIPNSTFAWWGAWLNPSSEKIVFAPKKWTLSPERFNPNITPASWHLI